tara:strand:+ start:13026 stop:13394 length:369 start_codon:yes stop_codon:yes gene_type:complete
MKEFKSNPFKTILTICLALIILFLIQGYKLYLYVCLVIGLIGTCSKFIAIKIETIWFKIGQIFGYIVPNILLVIIYYLFLFPISIITKIFKKDDLLKLDKKYNTTYVKRNKKFDADSFKKPF